ncbi:hypothetical protein ANTHELSMS3_02067 [Antarctobacter heliothermus]|uniref:Secreted protein n=1 Tax=Antarctobacter heliothermus TaxID=74033 RepID=A0A222E3H4_9RHOB|nr:hypothetical protein [Antarctobacter heliothermus]ASP20747.1 hypothetical protein ANTHELSMS3_02067 [Antarctobacter heliothermus]
MYLLAGLMGLMALGSVAIVSMGDDTDDTPHEDGDELDAVAASLDVDPEQDGVWHRHDDDALADGRSLFDRMGLINIFDAAPSEAGEPSAEPVEEAQGAVEVLTLHGFRIEVGDAAQEQALPGGAMPGDIVADARSEPIEQLDYDAAEDQLLIVFDDSTPGPEPQLEMRLSKDDPDTTEIRLGGRVLANLPTDEAPPLSSIFLVGESDAAALGLAG